MMAEFLFWGIFWITAGILFLEAVGNAIEPIVWWIIEYRKRKENDA